MANADVVTYNIAVFIGTLFLLEFGADKFIDHTAIVARRTGISETIVGLVTVGGEWEELVVVVASLARNRASLAVGNIIGSAISNILGAFSLGLLYYDKDENIHFDTSSRIYSLVLLTLTTFTIPIIYLSTEHLWLVCGIILIVCFAVYVVSVGWAITRGTLTAPEDSDSDGSDDGDDVSENEHSDGDMANDPLESRQSAPEGDNDSFVQTPRVEYEERTPLLAHQSSITKSLSRRSHRTRHSLHYHVIYLFFGFCSICLAGYVISHAATTIIDEFNISDVLFGVVILAVATTLPEKFIAVMSGHRGHTGVLVANTAGSNIFLLTLCAGIVKLDAKRNFQHSSVNVLELGMLWGSTAAFTATVWFGARFCRWIGIAMLVAYIAFVVLEFTVIRPHGGANRD